MYHIVERAACVACSKHRKATVTETSGYLASAVGFSDQTCGTQHCPWLIEGTAGQKINISFLDYSSYQNPNSKQVCVGNSRGWCLCGSRVLKYMTFCV